MALSDDAIIAMARDANPEHDLTAMLPFLSRFAALVAEKEREKCIDLVAFHGGSVEIEASMRARGQAMSNHRHTTAAYGRFSFGRTTNASEAY